MGEGAISSRGPCTPTCYSRVFVAWRCMENGEAVEVARRRLLQEG